MASGHAGGHVYDITQHMNGVRHKTWLEEKVKMSTIMSLFTANNIEHHTWNAELMFSSFLLEHNVLLAAAVTYQLRPVTSHID